MEFGLFNSLYVPRDHPGITEASRLRDEIELVKAAELPELWPEGA